MKPISFLLIGAALLAAGCSLTARHVLSNVVLREQTALAVRDPADLPGAPIPAIPSPRTVSDPRPGFEEWRLSLDEAIRIALVNARVIRVLAGITAVSSNQTIYDPAIANAVIDQEQARFDPAVDWRNSWNRNESPFALFDPFHPNRSLLAATRTDDYRSDVAFEKQNVLGGRWALRWVENPTRFTPNVFNRFFPLNPQNRSLLELGYTQPLLQGGGFAVNTAPIVIARIDTERSFFQYKDAVQDMVRGVIEAYLNLVQARIDVWARQIQVDLSEFQYRRERERRKVGFGDLRNEAQARTSYNQFRANLIAAQANVLAREGALRNILGLPPEDGKRIVPVSAPTSQRARHDWEGLLRLAEQRRPDIVELKLILEADQLRLLQAENRALPRLDALALYRWNGLSGEMPNGERLSNDPGQFTDWTIGVNFSVPLGLRDGRARVRQQSLVIARDRANLEQGLHATVHSIAITLRELDNAYEQYRAYKEMRSAALDNLKVQLGEVEVGRSIFLTILQALNDWGNAVSFEAQALIAYNVSLANLERQTGTILETHGLVFNEERFRAAGPLGVLGKGRYYPAAVRPDGMPHLYPDSGEPGENAFDLRKPEVPRGPVKPPEKLPPPRIP